MLADDNRYLIQACLQCFNLVGVAFNSVGARVNIFTLKLVHIIFIGGKNDFLEWPP